MLVQEEGALAAPLITARRHVYALFIRGINCFCIFVVRLVFLLT